MGPGKIDRVVEFFCGLGGWRRALGQDVVIAAAYDISPHAVATYALNHGLRPVPRELATLPALELSRHGANTWVMSPPCQPFCRMGRRLDLDDRRSRAFLHLMDLFRENPPEHFLLESVDGFLGSAAHALLTRRFEEAGCHWLDYTLCPTTFGIPNQRPRAFVVASRAPLALRPPPRLPPTPLAGYLDAQEDPALYLSQEVLAKHYQGLDLVDATATRSACFIGGYGQRYVGNGSFLATSRGVRRFSCGEVARLLGWAQGPSFPEEINLEARYKLLGNGLSLPVARWVAGQLLTGLQNPTP